jgi:enolase
MPTIEKLQGLEILDSRGRPTVRATCRLTGGAGGTASVPSGASTGRAEAVELRDGDETRYGGLGCRTAVRHINEELDGALSGASFADQEALDRVIIELDGTSDKSRLGANALLAVSLAFARAVARERTVPLYRYFAEVLSEDAGLDRLPRPTINLFSGGLHAGGQVPLQDVLVVPAAAASIDELLAVTYAVYREASNLAEETYGMRRLTADEGGLAPPFSSAEAMLADAVEAIQRAGFIPGEEVGLAVDVASSHFFINGMYRLDDTAVFPSSMIDTVVGWIESYPIVSVEDALAEDDWKHWPELRRRIDGRALVLGDDLLCTNPGRIERAIRSEAADALLLKVNQIGTLTEAADAHRLARSAGWQVTISARSGETEDNWLADLAVGWQGDQLKVGSITQSDRLAKYNRLLAIEADTHLPVNPWPGSA